MEDGEISFWRMRNGLGDRIRQFVYHADWLLIGVVLVLVQIGLIAVWSFSPPLSHVFEKQILWVVVGLAAFLGFSLLDYRVFRNHGLFLVALYAIVVCVLGGLLVAGPVTRGVRAWLNVGGAGIQPVEVAKLVLVLVLAKYFSRRHIEISRIRHLIISGLYVGFAAILVLKQPDLGSALILGAIWLAVVFFSGIQLRHLAIFFLLTLVLSGIAWTSLLLPYQKARITGFLDPYRDPRGTGYNTIQAMIAAGSGKIWGKGIGYGTQSHLNFLPEAETDFIFAAFTEETGFIGAILLLGLFGVFFWRITRTGIQAEDNFSKLYVLGFLASVFSAFFIHIAINLGLLPVTGIGLPLISYGGSSLITTLAGLGILQSIHINSRPEVG